LALAACGGSSHPVAGGVAPPWSDPLSTGGTMASASLRGDPVYLNFFATWCPPCNEEAPYIERLSRLYERRGLHVVGVDVEENAELAQRFRAKYHLTYPILVDTGTLENLYRVNGLPVHVFIERDGTIHQIVIGEMSKSQITTAVKAIL
jgi:cytochrome c biogenesis protein CcmG, thiol:disulfide interchange protein DsbE